MASTEIALKLILSEFGPVERDNRSYLQYITYLLQASELGLGFHFGWWHRRSGVFCEKFCGAYYNCISQNPEDKVLIPRVHQHIFKVKSLLLDKPEGLSMEEWVNLLTNYHFLRTRSSLDADETLKHISVGYYCVEHADKSLKVHGFLS